MPVYSCSLLRLQACVCTRPEAINIRFFIIKTSQSLAEQLEIVYVTHGIVRHCHSWPVRQNRTLSTQGWVSLRQTRTLRVQKEFRGKMS